MLQQLSVIAFPVVLSVAAFAGWSRLEATPDADLGVVSATVGQHEGASIAAAGLFSAQAKAIRFVVAPTGNEARYRVREQLAGMDFPNDAIGKTSQVTGGLLIGADGRFVRDSSSFTVDLVSLKTDNDRRDNYVRRNTLQTDSFPKAVFVPTSAKGLPATLPATGEMTFELTGDLTIHGVTKPATWQVKAARNATGAVTGTATTTFNFAEFGIATPKVARVLSVDDKITLEYDFNLVPQPATK